MLIAIIMSNFSVRDKQNFLKEELIPKLQEAGYDKYVKYNHDCNSVYVKNILIRFYNLKNTDGLRPEYYMTNDLILDPFLHRFDSQKLSTVEDIVSVVKRNIPLNETGENNSSMSIVEFAEGICNFDLMPYQKEFLEKAYEAAKSHRTLYYMPSRGCGKFAYEALNGLAILMVALEEGLLKGE